ncbi:MAG: B12-binding domain-containing radical SAM protein [Candidatus Omnitrophica bacterium]|nr:B12-binding domain-containing radical SAM protein [Candidatus Omnitrophota bacterium]MBU2250975.1 B12-binding domain-containing radical SAM protein [Candidatus Omnitrophota bacterium]
MKILLLFPRWTAEYGIFSHFAKKASIWPPLNLAYIAALAEKLGHTVKIIDAEAENISLEKITKEIENFNPDIIGMTATTPFFHIVVEHAKAFKRRFSNIPIVIGGAHITILQEKDFPACFDYAFIGEAEESWVNFLNRYENDEDISGIKGIIYRKDGKTISTGSSEPVKDIDSIPYPARHLLNREKYNIGTLRGRKNFTTIMTTRGCPFKCIFCSTKVFGSQVRRRSVDSVIAEIKSVIYNFNTRHFTFLDDTLTLDRNYILAICQAIIKENLKITFDGSTRANLIDEELVEVMANSGLIRISFGLETVDPEIRKIIKKEVPLDSYEKANRITNKYGIETLNSIMLGLPGETAETVGKTLSFLRQARDIQQANFSIATPYPGTELYDMARRGDYGLRLLTEDYSRYRRYGSAVMEVNELSAEKLLQLQNDGFLSIYSAPWRILPMIRKSGILGAILMLFRLTDKIKRCLFQRELKK